MVLARTHQPQPERSPQRSWPHSGLEGNSITKPAMGRGSSLASAACGFLLGAPHPLLHGRQETFLPLTGVDLQLKGRPGNSAQAAVSHASMPLAAGGGWHAARNEKCASQLRDS